MPKTAKIRYILAALSIVGLTVFYLFLSRPVSYSIIGPIDSGDAKELLDTISGSNSRLGVDKSKINAVLRTIVPRQRDIKITHTFMSTSVNIEIESAAPTFLWQSRGVVYSVDDGGVVTGQASTESTLPLVLDEENADVTVGSQIVPQDTAIFIAKLHQNLLKTEVLKISKYSVADSTRTLYAYFTDTELYALFDTTRQAEPQAESLNLLLAKKEAGQLQVQQYIDLRLPGRAYVK